MASLQPSAPLQALVLALQLPHTRDPPAQPPGVTDMANSPPATSAEGTQGWDGSAGPKCD